MNKLVARKYSALVGFAAAAALLAAGLLNAEPELAAGGILDSATRAMLPNCVDPPTDMLVWLPFDQLDTVDVLVNGMPGTKISAFRDHAGVNNYGLPEGVMGAAPPTTGSGMVGNALMLNGQDQFARVEAHPELDFGTEDFTVDAWVFTAIPADLMGYRPIVDKMAIGPADAPYGYTLFIEDGHLGFIVAGINGTIASATSTASVGTGWQFVAVTVKRVGGLAGTLYINDQPEGFAVSASADSANSPSDIIVGSRNRSSRLEVKEFFHGAIDELELFSRALTQAELAAIYGAGAAGKCKPWLQPDWQKCGPGDPPPYCDAVDEMVNIDIENGCGSAADGFQFTLSGGQTGFVNTVNSTNYPVPLTYEVTCASLTPLLRCNPFTPSKAVPLYDNALQTITLKWMGNGSTQIPPSGTGPTLPLPHFGYTLEGHGVAHQVSAELLLAGAQATPPCVTTTVMSSKWAFGVPDSPIKITLTNGRAAAMKVDAWGFPSPEALALAELTSANPFIARNSGSDRPATRGVLQSGESVTVSISVTPGDWGAVIVSEWRDVDSGALRMRVIQARAIKTPLPTPTATMMPSIEPTSAATPDPARLSLPIAGAG